MDTSKYWVTCNDAFMSGWGYAKNKINKLVFECDSFNEAVIVQNNALNREDQRYVNIREGRKPYFNHDKYYVQYIDKSIYPNWYKPNFFKRGTK